MVSWQAFPSLPPSLLVRPLAFLSRLNSWFKSWFIVGFSGKNSEPTVKQRKNVFSRKHRAHCLKAMPGYWCKIAKHCKQILLPEIVKVFTRTWKESNVAGTFQSISSRSLKRGDENGSGNIEISLGYRRRGRVSSSLGSYKTDNPK